MGNISSPKFTITHHATWPAIPLKEEVNNKVTPGAALMASPKLLL